MVEGKSIGNIRPPGKSLWLTLLSKSSSFFLGEQDEEKYKNPSVSHLR